jgi:endonuclease/exonuclease/phosphatase family metal-dependent hydrolase
MKFRLLTFNIHKGFNFLGTKFVLHELKAGLKELNADFLLLQEVVGENHNHKKKIKDWPSQHQMEFLADTVWKHYSYGKNAVFPNRHHGNATLSKFPIVKVHNLNISTNKFEQRGLLHCQVDIIPLGKKMHLFNTHLNLLSGSRKIQIQKITHYIEKQLKPDDFAIFAGDFNDWPEQLSHDLSQKNLSFQEGHFAVHKKHAKTFPNFLPLLCLDRIYLRNVKLIQVRVLKDRHFSGLSDHLPILIEFSL